MELSDSESALIDRLRSERRGWPALRFIALFCSCALLFKGVSGLRDGVDQWSLLLLTFGLYYAWYTARTWRGKPETQLLLKLLDSTKSGAEQCAAGDVRNARA